MINKLKYTIEPITINEEALHNKENLENICARLMVLHLSALTKS